LYFKKLNTKSTKKIQHKEHELKTFMCFVKNFRFEKLNINSKKEIQHKEHKFKNLCELCEKTLVTFVLKKFLLKTLVFLSLLSAFVVQ